MYGVTCVDRQAIHSVFGQCLHDRMPQVNCPVVVGRNTEEEKNTKDKGPGGGVLLTTQQHWATQTVVEPGGPGVGPPIQGPRGTVRDRNIQ